jgi:hypothetical protein
VRRALAHGAALLTLALALAPGQARAQQLGAPPEVTAPMRAGWTLTPSFSVAPLWDSNVALTSDEQGELEDQVLIVGSGLRSNYRSRRGQFILEYLGTYEFYRRYSEFDAPDHRARIEAQHSLSRRVSAFVRNSFALSPTTNIPFSDTGLLVLRRRTTSSNDFRTGLDITAGRRSFVTLAYNSQWVNLEDDELVQPLLRSGYSHRGDVQFRQRISPRVTLGARYDFQHAIVAEGEEAFDIQHAGGLFEWAMSPSLQLFGAAGYAWQIAGRGQEAQSAPAFMAELRYLANRTTWSVGYSRTFLASFGFGGTVQNEELRASVQVPISRRVELQGRLSARDNDPLSDPLVGVGAGAGLRALSATGTLSFELASWLRFEAFTAANWQDARRAGGQIERVRAGVRFVTFYPMRLG